MLRSRFPDHTVTIVPADTALRAGWALTSRDKGEKVKYRYRPQYFAEVWRPGEPSLAIPLTDHVFRLLVRGDVEEYRALVHASRHVRARLTFTVRLNSAAELRSLRITAGGLRRTREEESADR
ncbi:hypothetical protein [Streptomyces cyaneofuscatus]|uniref:hypothetical protein n=1 Tax=Streptomyces cyaneofuscatus TaxID=66883 RepID=UPI00380F4176